MRSPAPLPVVEPLAGGAVDAFHVTGEPPLVSVNDGLHGNSLAPMHGNSPTPMHGDGSGKGCASGSSQDVVEQLTIWDDVSVSTAALVNIVMAKQSKALGKKPVECQAVVIKSQREQPAVTGADSVVAAQRCDVVKERGMLVFSVATSNDEVGAGSMHRATVNVGGSRRGRWKRLALVGMVVDSNVPYSPSHGKREAVEGGAF
ncbi:hypothetical protein ACOSQ3_032417 [Xanthoceras sorbifolium]